MAINAVDAKCAGFVKEYFVPSMFERGKTLLGDSLKVNFYSVLYIKSTFQLVLPGIPRMKVIIYKRSTGR